MNARRVDAHRAWKVIAILAAIAILALALGGCTTTIEATTNRLDDAEQAVRLGRVHYQERLDRISLEWICTGMSWASLVSLTGGDQALIDAVMEACRNRIFPSVATP